MAKLLELFGYLDADVLLETPDFLRGDCVGELRPSHERLSLSRVAVVRCRNRGAPPHFEVRWNNADYDNDGSLPH